METLDVSPTRDLVDEIIEARRRGYLAAAKTVRKARDDAGAEGWRHGLWAGVATSAAGALVGAAAVVAWRWRVELCAWFGL